MIQENQKAIVDEIIKLGRDYEYSKSNRIIEFAVKEWQEDLKTNKEAYDKIYKKVVKNEHYIANRYSNIDDTKRIQVMAELYVEEIIDDELFAQLDDTIKNKVLDIANIKR